MAAENVGRILLAPGAVTLGVVFCLAWYARGRRLGIPQATIRELAWNLAAVIPFTLCAALAAVHPRLHYLWYVVFAIAVAHQLRQFLAYRRAKALASNR
jgi:hypothetical protein